MNKESIIRTGKERDISYQVEYYLLKELSKHNDTILVPFVDGKMFSCKLDRNSKHSYKYGNRRTKNDYLIDFIPFYMDRAEDHLLMEWADEIYVENAEYREMKFWDFIAATEKNNKKGCVISFMGYWNLGDHTDAIKDMFGNNMPQLQNTDDV